MRIRQVSDVKQQLQITRIPKLVAEAQHLDSHWPALAIGTEAFQKVITQCMDRVFGGVDYLIRERTYPRHRGAFRADCLTQVLTLASGMRAAGFTETVLQSVGGGFEKEHKNAETGRAQCGELLFKIGEERTFSDVDYERGTLNPFLWAARVDESSERGQKSYGQIVDAKISEVFEGVSSGGHARAAQAGDNHNVGRSIATLLGCFDWSRHS